MTGAKVVVIGSGIGGSGVAALLQNNGFDVTLLEKNRFYGGKCHSFEKDSYIVDSGVHMYSTGEAGPLQEINNAVGGDLKWLTQRHLITFRFSDKFWLNYCQPPLDPIMISQLGYIELMTLLNRGMQGQPVVAGEEARIKKVSNTLFKVVQRDGGIAGVLREMLKLVTSRELFLSDIDRLTSCEFLSSFTDNLIIHQLVAYASQILTVIPYTESSAGELFWCGMKQILKHKVGIPKGGSRAIPAAYLKALKRDGGTIELEAKVKEILINGGQVTGVKTEDGREFKADIVISNAGIKPTVDMAGKKSFPADYVKRVDGLIQSNSGITRKYGLAKKVVDVGSSGYFYVPDLDPVHMFDYIYNGEAPLEPCLFTPIPSELDETLAPLGKQLVLMGMPGPKDGSTEESRKHCDAILQKGEERMFECFPEMEKNIEWKMQTDTHFYARITGKPTGECIGIAQCAGQTGADKPNVKTPVEGLYLVGCDAGARGVGTEQAAGSAIRVAQVIQSEMLESSLKGAVPKAGKAAAKKSAGKPAKKGAKAPAGKSSKASAGKSSAKS